MCVLVNNGSIILGLEVDIYSVSLALIHMTAECMSVIFIIIYCTLKVTSAGHWGTVCES